VWEWLGQLCEPFGALAAQDFGLSAFFIALAINAALTAASYALQRILNKPKPIERNKLLSDIQLLDSSFDGIIPEIVGGMVGSNPAENGVRVSGNVIWMSEIRLVTEEREEGGKGGPSIPVKDHHYYVDIAVSVGRGPLGLMKIWAGSDLIYDESSTAATGGYSASYPQDPYDPYYPPNTNSDDADVVQRQNVRFNLFLGVLTVNVATGAAIRFYEGNETQTPDSLIQADVDGRLGSGSTPAYRGQAYVVLENFEITKYGSIPNFTFLVYNKKLQSLKAIGEDYLTRVGTPASDMALAPVDHLNVRGYVMAQRQSARAVLETLGRLYNAEFTEANGKWYAVETGSQAAHAIATADFGATEGEAGGEEPPPLVETQIVNDTDIPRQIDLRYFDPARDHQPSTQPASRFVTQSRKQETIEVPCTLTAAEARRIAFRELYQGWLERKVYSFTLPYTYAYLKPTDVVTFAYQGRDYRIRLLEIQGGVPGVLRCSGVEDEPSLARQSAGGGGAAGFTAATVGVTVDSIMALMDIPLLRDKDDSQPGFYAALSPTRILSTLTKRWPSASLYRDRGAGYELVATFKGRAVMGAAVGVLASGPTTVWDNTGTVQVDLYDGALESADAADVLAGANAALLGNEIIQFQAATQVGGYQNRWQLSGLLRGRKGTESYTGTHASGERFVLLNDAVRHLPMQLADRGVAFSYKAVTEGMQMADAAAVAFTWEAVSLKPYSGVHVAGARDGSNNLTITWVRRSRLGRELPPGADIPLGEESERYEVDILNAGLVIRTITGLTTPTTTYSAAQQTTDFGSPQPSLTVRVYQLAAGVGRGFKAEATI
jgi:hypothetical protein